MVIPTISNITKKKLTLVSRNVSSTFRQSGVNSVCSPFAAGTGASQVAKFTTTKKRGPKSMFTVPKPNSGYSYQLDPVIVQKSREELERQANGDSIRGNAFSAFGSGGGGGGYYDGDVTFVKASGPSDKSPNTPNYSFPTRKLSIHEGSKVIGGGSGSGVGGSGGGGKKHKCPKCGALTMFHHSDFEENTFYCASCSGWFLVKNADKQNNEQQQQQQNSSQSNVTVVSEEGMDEKSGGAKQRKISRPQILMEHVSHIHSLKCVFASFHTIF